MKNPDITYVIHIASTPERLWDALTSAEALQKNWAKIESQWTAGAQITEVDDSGNVLWKGEVLHAEPPHRLSFTFDVTGSGEPATEVAFDLSPPVSKIEPDEQIVRLTVTQGGFTKDSKVFSGCVRAWPEILSSVKTYVETGRPLRFAWRH
ncbi:MAG: SRPBCC domain-containing protein [Bryobacteraceae bacterium]